MTGIFRQGARTKALGVACKSLRNLRGRDDQNRHEGQERQDDCLPDIAVVQIRSLMRFGQSGASARAIGVKQ